MFLKNVNSEVKNSEDLRKDLSKEIFLTYAKFINKFLIYIFLCKN